MATTFEQMWTGLRDTATALIAANESIKRTAEAALAISGDYQDVKEQGERLATRVDQLTAEVRHLRERLDRR